MKKRYSFILTALLVLSLLVTGCGGGGSSSGSNNTGNGTIVGYLSSDGTALQISPTKLTNANLAVKDATVTVVNTKYSTTTNADGYFIITGVPAGSCMVTAVSGQLTLSLPVTVTAGGQVTPAVSAVLDLSKGADINLSALNSKTVYTMLTAQPTTKPEANTRSNTPYSLTLKTTAPAAGAQNHFALSQAQFNNLNRAPYSEKQIARDTQTRQLENELLVSRAKQLTPEYSSNLNPAVNGNVAVGTPWTGVNVQSSNNNQWTKINTTCQYVSKHAYFFVDNRTTNTITNYLAGYGAAFDKIYDINHAKFGSENDVDKNGKLIIVITPELTDGLLGYFYAGDKFTRSQSPNSNEGDIFYLTADANLQGTNTLKGTLAHEFQHMIYFDEHYNRGVINSMTWLNEALSQAAEYDNGYVENHEAWMKSFLRGEYQGLSLTHWTDKNYGYGAIFIRYIMDQYGDAAIKNLCSTDKVGIKAVEAATGKDFNLLFNDFSRAMVLSGTGLSTDPHYNFKSLNLKTLNADGLVPNSQVTAVGAEGTASVYPYELRLYKWSGKWGTINISGDSFVGSAFGLNK